MLPLLGDAQDDSRAAELELRPQVRLSGRRGQVGVAHAERGHVDLVRIQPDGLDHVPLRGMRDRDHPVGDPRARQRRRLHGQCRAAAHRAREVQPDQVQQRHDAGDARRHDRHDVGEAVNDVQPPARRAPRQRAPLRRPRQAAGSTVARSRSRRRTSPSRPPTPTAAARTSEGAVRPTNAVIRVAGSTASSAGISSRA